jgi:hypothetical protein
VAHRVRKFFPSLTDIADVLLEIVTK